MRILFKACILFYCLFMLNNKLKAQINHYEIVGDYLQIAIPAAAGISTILWNNGTYQDTKSFVKVMATSSAIALSMKAIFNKTRPNGGPWAFPSGHTTAAFTGAFFIQEKYGWKFGIPACALASYVAWSRIQAKKHDLQDVTGGVIVALFSTYLFAYELNSAAISISPVSTQGGIGFEIAYVF